MGTKGRLGAAACALALMAGACTSGTSDNAADGDGTTSDPSEDATISPSDDTTAGGDDASGELIVDAQGITDDTIKISSVVSDLSVLSEQNLAPEIGKPEVTLDAVVAHINAEGGVLGRDVELVHHVVGGADAALNPDAGRQACLQATADDQPFAVIIAAAITVETIECVSREENVLTIAMDSIPDSIFEQAEGRLFSLGAPTAIRQSRLYGAWPRILDDLGELDGRTIGIIRGDAFSQEVAVNDELLPAIEALGYDVASISVLPCPEGSTSCEQHDAAIQRLKAADVDFVFLVAQVLAGSASVEAAANLDFTPQWATIGNNITDTVARFYVNASENYDGAWGIDTGFDDTTEAAARCNEIAVANGAEEFPTADDGYSFTAVTCLQLLILLDAIEAAAETATLTQASVIEAMEGMETVDVAIGPIGTLGPDKHDAANFVFVSRYDMAEERFLPVDPEPIPVD